MNIRNTIDELLAKVDRIESLEAEYEKVKEAGDEIAMQSILKQQEELADSLEPLVDGMDFSDADEVVETLAQDELEQVTEALRKKVAALNTVVEHYDKAVKDGDQLEMYRRMKEIRGIGREIARMEIYGEG